jgi:hypothetical protein
MIFLAVKAWINNVPPRIAADHVCWNVQTESLLELIGEDAVVSGSGWLLFTFTTTMM